MATNTSTIKSAGGTYPSRSAWWAALGGNDLVTATTIEEAECYDFEDTTAFSMTTGTTNASYYYRIFTAAGNKHDGSFGTGARIKASVGSGFVINNKVRYNRIEDQSIENTAASNGGCMDCGGADDLTITGNIMKAVGTTNRDGLQAEYVANGIIKDNLVISPSSSDTLALQNSTGFAYNNTAINTGASGNAIGVINSSISLVNNIGQGGSAAYTASGYSGTATNNLSDDTSAPGTSQVHSQTLTFDADYNLVAGDTAAHTAGIGPASDSEVRTVDNIDVARSGTTCSIGCREYVAAGGGIIISDTFYRILLSGGGM